MTDSSLGRGLIILGGTLALGLALAAFILGYQAKQAAAQRQSIVVKGLAEKTVKADRGELGMTLFGKGASPAEALTALRSQQGKLMAFIKEQGFKPEQIETGNEDFTEVMKSRRDKEGNMTEELDHYAASQQTLLLTQDVQQIARTEKASLALRESGMSLSVAPAQYLVSALEDVKMSLIGSATQNAFSRAGEFAKHGNAKVGVMKSASQGAFYILPARGGSNGDNEYGGVYDKSTIDKIARVVVTIEYSIAP